MIPVRQFDADVGTSEVEGGYPRGIASGRPGTLTVISDGSNVDAQPVRKGRWQFWKIASITYKRHSGGLEFVSIHSDTVLSWRAGASTEAAGTATVRLFSRVLVAPSMPGRPQSLADSSWQAREGLWPPSRWSIVSHNSGLRRALHHRPHRIPWTRC